MQHNPVKVTECTAESTCMEVADPEWSLRRTFRTCDGQRCFDPTSEGGATPTMRKNQEIGRTIHNGHPVAQGLSTYRYKKRRAVNTPIASKAQRLQLPACLRLDPTLQ